MLNIVKGMSKATGSFWKLLLPTDEVAQQMGEKYASLYGNLSKHDQY